MKPSSLAVVCFLALAVASCSGHRADERTAAASPAPSAAASTPPPLATAPGDTLPAAPGEPPGTPAPGIGPRTPTSAPSVASTPLPPGHVDPATGVRIEDAGPTPPPKHRRSPRSHARASASTLPAAPAPQPVPPPDAQSQPQTRNGEPRPDEGGPPPDARTTSRDDSRDEATAPLVLPAGTELPIRLDDSLASDTSRPEQDVTARLAQDVRVQGRVVLPAGSEVLGHVVVAQPSGRVSGRARLVVAFDAIRTPGRTLQIEAWRWDTTAGSSRDRDTKIAGGAAAAGAIIGAITGGAGGALKGGLLGGAAGGAAVLATRGKEVEIPAGTGHTITLRKPLQVV